MPGEKRKRAENTTTGHTEQPEASSRVEMQRIQLLSKARLVPEHSKGIVYWMARDKRAKDNWSLLHAQDVALANQLPLHVVYCVPPHFGEYTWRHYDWILKGLKETEQILKDHQISLHVYNGFPLEVLPVFVKEHQIGGIVTDFWPLRTPRAWVNEILTALPDIPLWQVDAYNIVPCLNASSKKEYAARTIRPKIMGLLSHFLKDFPALIKHPHVNDKLMTVTNNYVQIGDNVNCDRTVKSIIWAKPGEQAGLDFLQRFCNERLKLYAEKRNDPTAVALSDLSVYFQQGHLSAQRAILQVKQHSAKYPEAVKAFIEETVVRRELSDNFCYYNPHYDSLDGAEAWAKESLQKHSHDRREFVYTEEELERGVTHDRLWNAAQKQLIMEGKMHGFMRMYWAKKILEWTRTPDEALRIAQRQNDRYAVDGNCPNGYVGVDWSIMGTHDQGWAERPVFGKIRYMNYEGCKRKFNVDGFINRYKSSNEAEEIAKTRARELPGYIDSPKSNYAKKATTDVEDKVKRKPSEKRVRDAEKEDGVEEEEEQGESSTRPSKRTKQTKKST